MNNTPRVSIIMGIFNCGNTLRESLTSIVNQTFRGWELIMCDDGSSDNTYEIASEFAKKYPEKIRLLKNEKNMGLNYTLNKCADCAQGVYIARQDGDDISELNRLEKEITFLDTHPEYAFVGSNMTLFDDAGSWGKTEVGGEVKKETLGKCNPFMHPTVVIRRAAFESVGKYSVGDNLLRVEDYHLWLKLYIAGYKGYNLDDTLYQYRDDRNAFAKRTIKNRVNMFHTMQWGISQLNLNAWYRLYPCKQLLLILFPSGLYSFLHKKKWSAK